MAGGAGSRCDGVYGASIAASILEAGGSGQPQTSRPCSSFRSPPRDTKLDFDGAVGRLRQSARGA